MYAGVWRYHWNSDKFEIRMDGRKTDWVKGEDPVLVGWELIFSDE
jgi:hypothetical protein